MLKNGIDGRELGRRLCCWSITSRDCPDSSAMGKVKGEGCSMMGKFARKSSDGRCTSRR